MQKRTMRLFTIISSLFLVCLAFSVSAQDYVGLSVKEAQRRLKKETRSQQPAQRSIPPFAASQETLSGVLSSSTDLQLACDSTGVCYAEHYLCADEPSALQRVRKILAKKEYGWQALNENQYVSSMERQRLLEIYRQDSFWVVQVLTTDWSPLQYRLLFSNENK